jgi:diguanylate cyclase (GGDEF)-like protein
MRIRGAEKTVIAAWALVCLGIILSLVIRPGFALTASGDLIQCFLLLLLSVRLVRRAKEASGRARVFWLFLTLGSGVWLAAQILWTDFEILRRHEVPNPFVGDIAIFLHLVPFMAAFAVRPDATHSRFEKPEGTDFALLLTWWTFLYVFVVIPWQYVSPDAHVYGIGFDALYFAEHFALLVIVAFAWHSSAGQWRTLYRRLLFAAAVYALSSVAASVAIDFGVYHTGSAFDIPLLIAMGMFVHATSGREQLGLSLEVGKQGDQQPAHVSTLANVAAISLPALAAWAAFFSDEAPEPVRRFRLGLTLITIMLIGGLRSAKQYRLESRLTHANQELREVSLTDLLTGVRNRRFFATTIDSDVQQVTRSYLDGSARRNNCDLIFYLIDIDHFKEVNDRFGHDEGDHVLAEIAFRISAAIRHSDVLVRWGGEEFLVVSRFASRDVASVLCGRILHALADKPLQLKNGGTFHRTCSIGWAAFPWFTTAPEAVNFEDVLRMADRALYTAKNSGRNLAIGFVSNPDRPPSAHSPDLVETLSKRVVRVAGPTTPEAVPVPESAVPQVIAKT